MECSDVQYKKGQVIQREEPLIVLQTTESKRSALCCSTCTAFLGGWSAQARLLSGNADAAERHRSVLVKALATSGSAVPRTCKGHTGHCQEVYCSEACQQAALWRWHGLECCSVVQPSDDSEEREMLDDQEGCNSMVEFEAHAQKVDEIFLAARRVICTLIMHAAAPALVQENIPTDTEEVLARLECLTDSASGHESVRTAIQGCVEWYHSTFPACPTLGTNKPAQLREYELSDSGVESWLLLHAALLERGVCSTLFAPFLSQNFFACVLKSLEKYMQTMGMRTSPLPGHLARYLAARPPYAENAKCTAEEEQCLAQLLHPDISADPVRLQELLADKLLLITELNGLESGAHSIAMAAGLGCDAVFRFTARDCQSTCMVLLPHLSQHAGHSCLPDIQLGATIAGQSAVLTTILAELPAGTGRKPSSHTLPTIDFVALKGGTIPGATHHLVECTVCYVDDAIQDEGSEFSLRSRQLKLSTQFNLDAGPDEVVCSCPRCKYETARTACKRLARAAAAVTVEMVMNTVADALAAFALEDMLTLGHFYMQQGLYVDAQAIYRSILARVLGAQCNAQLTELNNNLVPAEDDVTVCGGLSGADSVLAGEVFHALGAAHLESGDWLRSRQVWRYGLHCIPTSTQLYEEVIKLDQYPQVQVNILKPRAATQSSSGVALLVQGVAVPRRAGAALRCALFPRQEPGVDIQLVARCQEPSNQETHVLPAYVEVCEAHVAEKEARICLTAPSEQLLSAAECAWVIRSTEEFAAQAGGWTTSRHYAVPTTDIPVHLIKSTASLTHPTGDAAAFPLLGWFREVFEQRLGPLLASQYQDEYASDNPIHAAIHDAFVVKYDSGIAMTTAAEIAAAAANRISAPRDGPDIDQHAPPSGQTYLPLHCDQSSHSFTIALNSSGEYEGGGTYFPALGSVFRPDVGQVLSFPGGVMLHGGEPICRGTRYILAVFAYLHGTAKPAPAATALLGDAAQRDGMAEEAKPAKRARQEGCTGFADVVWKVPAQLTEKTSTAEEVQSGSSFSFNFA